MFLENFWSSGIWIFPVIGITVMIVFMFFRFGRGRMKPPWQNSEEESRPLNQDSKVESDTALEILNKRYAKGEITKEEFDRMKNDLG